MKKSDENQEPPTVLGRRLSASSSQALRERLAAARKKPRSLQEEYVGQSKPVFLKPKR